jgi:urease accessory protein
MTPKRPVTALAAVFALLPAVASAHVGDGHMHGLVDGVAHPLLGLDHLAAMVAVGLIAARGAIAGRLAVPAAFLAAMLAGAMLGMAGVALPAFETGIALSLVVLGALVALARPLSLAVSVPIVALFGLAHGAAHGLETPAEASGIAWIAGFMVATAILHATGLVAGLRLAAGRVVLAGAGGATALGGLLALAGG